MILIRFLFQFSVDFKIFFDKMMLCSFLIDVLSFFVSFFIFIIKKERCLMEGDRRKYVSCENQVFSYEIFSTK